VDETLEKLRQAQANRRPKMMRLTPAHSSLPARSFKSPVGSSGSSSFGDVSTPTPSSVAFPAKGPQSSASATAPLHPSSRKAVAMKQSAPADESPGLLIDLSHLPSPSVTDLEGPVTTSQIAPDRHPRDRHGNPIKSSLKSPAASHFLPPRADSVPSLPASMRFAKSVPTTPTVAKAVHFDSQLEHVKVFKFKQRPAAVSRDGSPEQTETETEEEKELFPFVYGRNRGNSSPDASFRTGGSSPDSRSYGSGSSSGSLAVPAEAEEQLVLRLPNFPSSTRVAVDREIFLERIYLADDLRSVKGSVQVRNMSFEKWVAIRFTLDKWASVNEVSADYAESIKDGAADRFTFSIKLNELLNWPRGAAAHETKSMFMCLRYTVGNAEYWDNNEGLNYQLDFRKRQAPSTPASTPAASAYSPSGSSVRSSFANGSGSSAKARIIEIARRGVHGGPRQAGFAMEDLRRELDRLKSDEEDEDRLAAAAEAEAVAEGVLPFLAKSSGAGSPSMERVSPELARAYLAEKAKRKQSPPSSPGGGRGNSSPSMWSARYDFGESLRNPRNGSRTTGHGRAAALDYFSSKPSPRAPTSATSSGLPSSTTPTPNQFIVSVSSPNGNLSSAASTPGTGNDSPDFAHRFGMISPGLVHNVEHRPIVAPGSESSSPQTSLVVPLAAGPLPPSPAAQLQIRTQQPQPQAASDRFYSWPHSRRTASPATTPTAGGSGSSGRENMFFEAMLQNGSPVESGSMPGTPRTPSPPADFSKGSAKASPHSSGATSPLSPDGSPSLFSPGGATSICSNDSDMTVVTPEDPHVLRLERTSHGTFADEADDAASATSSSNTSSPRLRPAALSDMQELVARYCWGTDLVPGGGSLVATPGTDAAVRVSPPVAPGHAPHMSPLASGASTPTLC
jgi:hypothetical protein